MDDSKIIAWLLTGDVSLQYQVNRDLLGSDNFNLQDKIAKEGWGKQFLSKRNSNGHWGDRFYQPKWISTHYTLLDLRNLNLSPDNHVVKETIESVLSANKANDGGIKLGPSTAQHSDVCVNGMFLNYASYFKAAENKLQAIVDGILHEIMPDGGFNCRTTRSGAKHSSLHSTLSVLEGFQEFRNAGYHYRLQDISNAIETAKEFILEHRLFLSDRTGEIINEAFLKLPYPPRWKYDILKALDFFRYSETNWDSRMDAAMSIILKKRNSDGTWNVQSAHAGQVHFNMEEAGKPSRWNTLRALRVIKYYNMAHLPPTSEVTRTNSYR